MMIEHDLPRLRKLLPGVDERKPRHGGSPPRWRERRAPHPGSDHNPATVNPPARRVIATPPLSSRNPGGFLLDTHKGETALSTTQRRARRAGTALAAGTLAASAALAQPATATAETYTPFLVGGQQPTEAYPFMGSLQYRHHPDTGERGFHTCGAALIRPDTVVTAAHCVSAPADGGGVETRDPNLLQVRIGSLNRSEGGTVALAQSITVHPDWHFAPGGDLATVHLTTPVLGVEPVRLADADAEPGAQRRVLGWGVTAGGQPAPGDSSRNPQMLRQQDAAVLADERCGPGQPLGLDPSTERCVSDSAGDEISGLCYGDSGGPMLRRDEHGRWELEGIASRGLAEPDCGTAPAIATDATAYRSWLATH